MLQNQRPISPHLQVYNFNLSSFTSIFGRACGVVSFLSILFLSWAIILDTFFVNQFLITILDWTILSKNKLLYIASVFVLWGVIFTSFFYFATVIRHLFWNFNIFIHIKYAKILSICVIMFGLIGSSSVMFLIITNLLQFKYLIHNVL